MDAMEMTSTLPTDALLLCTAEEGCTKPVHGKNLCQMHYRRLRLHGSTAKPQRKNKPGPKPDPTKPYSKHRPRKAHVWIPKTHCPEGHAYDEENTYSDARGYKSCRTCRRERMRERRPATIGPGGRNKAKTHCPKGHPYDEANTIYSKDGRRWCRTCSRANGAIQVIRKYGITVDKFEALLKAQDSACAICYTSFEGRKPHIDHDHACCAGANACGACVRGLLCSDCNRGLGSFRDTPARLRSAAAYLEQATA